MKRAGEAGKALRAGGGADFIFSASERVVMAFRLCAGALVCLRAYFHERRSLNNFHRDRVITFEQIAE
ncbi:hypothetical protein [Escherichia coli]|uniref:hypothetical protein n=1 Tax=Escherichia coli TaxID=562 RepID=UPI003CC8870D